MEKNFSNYPKRINQRCPMCNEKFNDSDMEIIKEMENGLMAYSTCSNCGVGMVAKLSLMPQGFVGVGVLTDLNRDEVILVKENRPISAEEVLNVKILTDKGILKINK